jgi:hypothetical protein
MTPCNYTNVLKHDEQDYINHTLHITPLRSMGYGDTIAPILNLGITQVSHWLPVSAIAPLSRREPCVPVGQTCHPKPVWAK